MALDVAKITSNLRDLTAKFDMALETCTPFYPEVCKVRPSNRRDEKYAWLGNMPGMREWLGPRQVKQLRSADYLLKNKTFESTLGIDRDDIEDDEWGMYDDAMPQLAEEAAYHPDELWFTALQAGESTACWDGQLFYDTDHLWGDSGSQSNDLTYNVTTPADPTPTEFLASYHQARSAVLNFKRDNGKNFMRPIIRGQRDFLCLVPTNMELAATAAFKSQIISNSTNIVLDTPRVVAAPSLTATDKWFLFYTGGKLKPFLFQARKPLTRQMKGLKDIEFKNVKFMTEARYNVGYLAWFYTCLTTLT